MRRMRSDHKCFEDGTPMGSEVLQWLQVLYEKAIRPESLQGIQIQTHLRFTTLL